MSDAWMGQWGESLKTVRSPKLSGGDGINIAKCTKYAIRSGAVLEIFIWVGQSKAKQILGTPTEVVYVGIIGMTRAVSVGQERVWVGQICPQWSSRVTAKSVFQK